MISTDKRSVWIYISFFWLCNGLLYCWVLEGIHYISWSVELIINSIFQIHLFMQDSCYFYIIIIQFSIEYNMSSGF